MRELTKRKDRKVSRKGVSTKGETDFSYCQDTAAAGKCPRKDVRIGLMAEHIAKPGILVRDVFFEGGEVLRCYRGRVRFTLEGRKPVVIGEREAIVIYPAQRVTIEPLDKVNLLVYAIFEGAGVADYFDRLGFFNGIHGETSEQIELFREVKHELEAGGEAGPTRLLRRLSDALVTYAHDLRIGANALAGEAVQQIRKNLRRKIVRLTPLYEQLRVGHTALSHAFRQAGLGSPAAFIRQEQLRLVTRQLQNTLKPISAIAEEAGFISATHFANFIKRNTGLTARELRNSGRFVKSRRES